MRFLIITEEEYRSLPESLQKKAYDEKQVIAFEKYFLDIKGCITNQLMKEMYPVVKKSPIKK